MRLLFLAVLAAAVGAEAGRVKPEYRVDAGFNGVMCDRSALVPVIVTIRNVVGPTKAVIEVFHSGGAREVTQRLPVELPAPSTKRFNLLHRADAGNELAVRILFDREFQDAEQVIRIDRSDSLLVLMVDCPLAVSQADAGDGYRSVRMGDAPLPEDPLAYDGVHAVMISGRSFAALGAAQVSALGKWLRTGGRVLFWDPLKDSGFEQNVALLLGSVDRKVYSEGVFPHGSGLIASSGVNPDAVSPVFWKQGELRRRMFPRVDSNEFRAMGGGLFASLHPNHGNYDDNPFKRFGWIMLIMGVYILAAGPLDWFLSKKLLKRPMLTWVLFPACIGLFTAAGFTYSNWVNVGVMKASSVCIADAGAGTSDMRGVGMLWLYSARNATYGVSSSQQGIRWSARESSMAGVGALAAVDIDASSGSLRARIPVFSSKDMNAAWYMGLEGGISCVRDGRKLSVRIPRGMAISSAWIADEKGVVRLVSASPTGKDGTVELEAEARGQRTWKDAGNGLESEIGSNVTRSYRRRNMFGAMERSVEVMTSSALEHYVLAVSFRNKFREAAKKGNSYFVDYRLHQCDGIESRLDVSSRLADSDVLLLCLGGKTDLLPVTVSGGSPEWSSANVVRIVLPK